MGVVIGIRYEDVTVKAADVFYARGLMARGLDQSIRQVNEIKSEARAHPDIPGTIRQSLEGAVAYHEQFIQEATVALERMPADLQPSWHMLPELDTNPW